MTLPSAGNPISLQQVNVELGLTATASINMGSSAVRGLFGVASGAIDMSDGYGKASFTGMSATGGTITTDGDYKVHTFTGSGTFAVSTVGDIGTVEYLLIAGGAGGANGGGGAGGYRTSVSGQTSGANSSAEGTVFLSSDSYSITVGAGGGQAGNGGNSTLSGVTSIGGGAGGSWRYDPGSSGGSGVGGNGINSESTAAGNGATNTGSGGGGRHSPDQYPSAATGGHGGSGVCIIRIPNASYSGTTTGSPVVRTDATYTYLTYKQNGTYTA